MAQVLVRHITKLTAMILVLGALAASAFIQDVHIAKLRADGSALKVLAHRNAPPPPDDAALLIKAASWLRENHQDESSNKDAAVEALTAYLKANGVDSEAIAGIKGLMAAQSPRHRWSFIKVDDSVGGGSGTNDADSDTVRAALARFVLVHAPSRVGFVSEVHPDATPAWATEPHRDLLAVRAGDGAVVLSFQRDSHEQRVLSGTVDFPVRATMKSLPGPPRADLAFGPSEAAVALVANTAERERLVRLYGELPLSEAQAIVARAVAARFNAVSLLGVHVPAEYFAVALVAGLAAVLLGLVAALRKAGAAGATPLDFMQSDSISALLLGARAGRLLLWLAVPLLAAAAVWPESWVTGVWLGVYTGMAGVVALLGAWAVRLGRVVTRVP